MSVPGCFRGCSKKLGIAPLRLQKYAEHGHWPAQCYVRSAKRAAAFQPAAPAEIRGLPPRGGLASDGAVPGMVLETAPGAAPGAAPWAISKHLLYLNFRVPSTAFAPAKEAAIEVPAYRQGQSANDVPRGLASWGGCLRVSTGVSLLFVIVHAWAYFQPALPVLVTDREGEGRPIKICSIKRGQGGEFNKRGHRQREGPRFKVGPHQHGTIAICSASRAFRNCRSPRHAGKVLR